MEYRQYDKIYIQSSISPEGSNLLASVGGGLTVRAIERKEGLECTRSARLGPRFFYMLGLGTTVRSRGVALWSKICVGSKESKMNLSSETFL